MTGLQYFKAEPTEFARLSVNGSMKKEGKGISAIYLPFRTSIELISVAASDHPFTFAEMTKESQEVTLQGGITYRVINPGRVLDQYNHSIDPIKRTYLKDDSRKLPEHLVQLVQSNAKRIAQATKLEDLLPMSDTLATQITEALSGSKLETLGVTVDRLYFNKISPKPELAKALEAKFRESLLQQADEATYKRRANAVNEERQIQENELNNRIQIEQKRIELVALEGKNKLDAADFDRQALAKTLDAYKDIEPEMLRSLGLYKIGENAQRIENLTLVPEMFAALRR